MQRIVANAIALARAAGRRASPPPPTPSDPRDFLLQWIESMEAAPPDGPGADPHYFDFEATFWRERARENLLYVHYDDMIADLAGEMRRISAFLGIDTPESLMPALARAAGFATMKAQGDALAPGLKLAFDRGADRFLNQGRAGRWREVLGPADVARYEALAGPQGLAGPGGVAGARPPGRRRAQGRAGLSRVARIDRQARPPRRAGRERPPAQPLPPRTRAPAPARRSPAAPPSAFAGHHRETLAGKGRWA